MIREGTFEDYMNRLNARRRELTAPFPLPPRKNKPRAMKDGKHAAGTPYRARTGGTTKAIELVGAASSKTLPLTMAASRLDGEGCMVAPLPHSTGMDYLDC